MKKIFLWLCCFLSAFALSGAVPEAWKSVKGELNIADTIPGGDEAVKQLALQAGLDNVNLTVNINRMSLKEGIGALENGSADILLAYEESLPERLQMRRRYAAEAALVLVNVRNDRKNFTADELCRIFSGSVNSWKTLTGSSFSIHRMGVPDGAAGAEVFKRKAMQGKPFDKELYRKPAGQLLILTGVNANAASFSGWIENKPSLTVREASVNGIAPTVENILSGRYPLAMSRSAVMGPKVSPQTRMFIQMLNGKDFKAILREHSLL